MSEKINDTIDDVVMIKSNYDIQKLKEECNTIINLTLDKIYTNQYNMQGWDKYPLYLPISNNEKFSKSSSISVNGFTNFQFNPTKYLDNCPYIKEIIDSFDTKIYYCYLSKLHALTKIDKHKDIDGGSKDWLNLDKIMRFHIPIITNPDVKFFIGDPIIKKYYLEEGNLYYTRTGDKTHYVENNSDQDRYHLIIDLKPTQDLLDKIIIDKKIKKLFENYEIVSLGYSCYPKIFIKKIIKKETHFFDYLGSSTWSIINLLNNNFDNFFNKKKYYYLNGKFKPYDKNFLIYNKEYYIRFVHDNDFLKSGNAWNEFKNKYTRRFLRFNKLLKSENKLLFLYLEENLLRFDKLYPEIKKYYPKKEKNYHIEQSKLEQSRMYDIVKIIKTKYNKHNFKIIYFSNFVEKTKYKDNIIFIKTDCHYNNFEWNHWASKQCSKSIIDNYDYINDILNDNFSFKC